jgi:integrase
MSTELNGVGSSDIREPKNRPNERGHLRFDRRFPRLGVPRLQRSSGTSDPKTFQERNDLLTQLATLGHGEELKAFAAGAISIDDIVKAFAGFKLEGLLNGVRAAHALETLPALQLPMTAQRSADIATDSLPSTAEVLPHLDRMLWSTAIDEIIPGMGELLPATRLRYATSIRALQRKLAVFSADDSAFEALATLQGSCWDALEQARMRGITVRRLEELNALSPSARRVALRETNTRVGEDVFTVIKTLPRTAWRALNNISEYLVHAELVNTLDRLKEADRRDLRQSAQKLGVSPTVGDLAMLTKTDWARFSRSWGGSSADWNHMRRALSAVITDLFGNSRNEFRWTLMEKIELKKERERVVDLTPELFWKIVRALPPEANAFPVVIVLTGTRISEYERLTRKNLRPRTCVVEIPGTKTPESVRDVQVDREFWHYVDGAVPTPREYGWLRRKWKEACAQFEVSDVTLHDLRHCHAQWALEAGAQEQAVQTTLGHITPGMTRRYTKTRQKGEVARAIGTTLRDSEDRPNRADA